MFKTLSFSDSSRFRLRGLGLFLCGLMLVSGVSSPALANDARTRELQGEEAELLHLLDQAQQDEAETIRLEDEAKTARAREIELERQELVERNAAVRRDREQALLRQINAEVAVESEMFERQLRNEAADSRGSLGAHAGQNLASLDPHSDPRLAPPTPKVRDLPRAIFEAKSVTIAPGTPGFDNASKLKLTRLVLDADRDGRPEIVRYVERKSEAWLRQEEDRNYDGAMDSFLRLDGKRLVERMLDNNDDGRPEIFETYADGLMVSRSLDRDDDGVVDAFYDYKGRFLDQERHDANNDGEVDLVIEYGAGRRVSSKEDTDRDGRTDTWIRYEFRNGFETISRIETDKAGRGFADTFETFDAQRGKAILARREEDLDGDGEIDVVSIYLEGKLVRRNILKPEVVPL